MKKLLACFVLLLMVASVLVPVGVGYSKSSVNLEVAAGELRIWNDWYIYPCKYIYSGNGEATIDVFIVNLSDKDIEFDMGDKHTLIVPRLFSGNDIALRQHKYRTYLSGQTERITITRLAEGTGIRLQQALILKIEPK